MERTSIPKTGRIGRFAKIIEKDLGEDILLEVMQDSDKYASFKAPEKAAWWSSAVERLEKAVGNEKAIDIMIQCGQKCCGQGMRKTAKRLMNESKSMEEFLEKASTYEVKEGEIEYTLKDAIQLLELSIDVSTFNILDSGFIFRIIAYTIVIICIAIFLEILRRKHSKKKGLITAIEAGIILSLNTVWASPGTTVVTHVVDGIIIEEEIIFGIIMRRRVGIFLCIIFGIATTFVLAVLVGLIGR